MIWFVFSIDEASAQYAVDIDGKLYETDTEIIYEHGVLKANRVHVRFTENVLSEDIKHSQVYDIIDRVSKEKRNQTKSLLHILNNYGFSYMEKVYPNHRRGENMRSHRITGEPVKVSDDSKAYYFHFNHNINVEELSEELTNLPFVEYAHGPELITSGSSGFPNDPETEQQWALEYMQFFDAWGFISGEHHVGIAISDRNNQTYTIYHEDMKRIQDGGNLVDTTLSDNMISPDNHGTFVAGVIGATTNNNLGIAGAAKNTAKIYSYYRGYSGLKNILDDIDDYGFNIDIINCSWNTPFNISAIETQNLSSILNQA